MSPKTLQLLELIRRSKSVVGAEHVVSLLMDAEKVGRADFIAELARHLSSRKPRTPPRRQASDLERRLVDLQARTGLDRKTFIEYLVEELTERNPAIKCLLASKRTFPKFIEHYKNNLPEEELERLAVHVAKKNSQAH